MTKTAISPARSTSFSKRPLYILSFMYALLGPVAAFAKMGTVPLLVIGLLGYPTKKDFVHGLKTSLTTPFAIACVVLLLWCLISLAWADVPHLFNLLRLCSVVFAALLFVSLVSHLDPSDASAVSAIALPATLFLIVVLFVEGLSGAYLHGLLRPQDTVPREGEWVPYLEMVAARGTAILAPLCFLVAPILAKKLRFAYSGLSIVIAAFGVTWLLPMMASSLAILTGGIVLACARWNRRVTTRILFSMLLVGALFAPLSTIFVLKSETFELLGLEPSRAMNQRMAIWEYSTEYIIEQPFFGYGFDASREIGKQGATIPDTNWAALPLHPHNAFLQIWLELGLIGIAILCLLLGQLWRIVEKEIEAGRRTAEALAAIAAAATLSLISFGVWQYWWIATWGLLGGLYWLQQGLESSH